MLRTLSLAIALLLAGCGAAPVATTVMPLAAIARVQVTVPLPQSQVRTLQATALAWNELRLSITPMGGGVTAVRVLEMHDGGFKGADAAAAFVPGSYAVHVELIQALHNAEIVVAAGDVSGADLQAGPNALALQVYPTVAGTQVALAPTSLDPQRVSRGDSYRRDDEGPDGVSGIVWAEPTGPTTTTVLVGDEDQALVNDDNSAAPQRTLDHLDAVNDDEDDDWAWDDTAADSDSDSDDTKDNKD